MKVFGGTALPNQFDRFKWLAAPLLIFAVQFSMFRAPLGVIINGAVLGLITALVALAMFLIYRSNRVLNFAQGEFGLIPAVLAVMLIVESDWPWLAALLVGAVAAGLLGGATEFLIIRRFFRAPRLILTVATLGLAQILAFNAYRMPVWWDARVVSQRIDSPLGWVWDVGPVRLSADHLLVLIIVPLVLLFIGALLRYTNLGIAVRAAAELPDRAVSLGIPVKSVHTLIWGIAGFLAFLALFLRAGVIGLPVGGSLGFGLLLRALAALMIGRLSHLPTVLVSSIALGILQQGIDWNQDNSFLGNALMAAVIIAALVLRRDRKQRGEMTHESLSLIGDIRRLPSALNRLWEVRILKFVAVAGCIGLSFWLPRVLETQDVLRLSYLYLFVIVLLSLVILTGWAGQLSLGHIAFLTVGSVLGAYFTQEMGFDLLLAVPVAGLGGAVASLFVGLPALRLRGLYLAVTSLAFAVATTSYLLNPRFFSWIPQGRIERQPLLGRIDWSSSFAMYHVSLIALILVFFAISGIRNSRTGRVLLAMRDNESAVAAYGVSPTKAKLMAFAISGFFASTAGALVVHHQQALVVESNDHWQSIDLFVAAVAGGISSVIGAVLGALYYWGGVWWLPGNWRLLVLGGGVLGVLLILPGGMASGLYQIRDAAARKLALRHGVDAPGFTHDSHQEKVE